MSEETDFSNKSDEQLVEFVKEHANRFMSDAVPIEMMRRLKNSIIEFNKESSKHSQRIFLLTIVMGIIALLQLGLLIYQIIQNL
jgi:hypothetical protein